MNIELALSLAALLISTLSALYARNAVRESKRANLISSHSHKLEIFESVKHFRNAFKIHAEATDAKLFIALFSSASKSSLYFTQPVAADLSKYSNAAFKVLIARDRANQIESIGRDVPPEKWGSVFRLVDECRALEGTLVADLEEQTKIVS